MVRPRAGQGETPLPTWRVPQTEQEVETAKALADLTKAFVLSPHRQPSREFFSN
jgi:hypothetical protein